MFFLLGILQLSNTPERSIIINTGNIEDFDMT